MATLAYRDIRDPALNSQCQIHRSHQRMMNKVFHDEISKKLKVYKDDMIVKSTEEVDHAAHLKKVFPKFGLGSIVTPIQSLQN